MKSHAVDANYFKGGNLKSYQRGRRQLDFNHNGSEKLKSNTVRTSGRGSGVDDKHNWDSIRIGQIGKGGQGDRIYSTDGKSVSLSANGGGRGAKTELYLTPNQVEKLRYLKGAKKEKREKNGYEYTFSEGALKLVQTDKSLPLLASGSNSIGRATNFVAPELIKSGTLTEAIGRGGSSKEYLSMLNKMENLTGIIRKLTPVECERLQSLDDNYTEGVSNTQRYKALGNAFNVEVVRHILSFMK